MLRALMMLFGVLVYAVVFNCARGDEYATWSESAARYTGSFLYATNRSMARLVSGPTVLDCYGAWRMETAFKGLPVVAIGKTAFSTSKISASDIIVPPLVTNIDDYAFQNVSGVFRIFLPEELKRIGDGAFDSCSSLVAVQIPASVIDIGRYPFAGCVALTSISVDTANYRFCSIDGALYDKDATVLIAAPAMRESISLPTSLRSVGDYAFYGSRLFMCTIPDGVTKIGQMSFARSESLVGVGLPNSVKEIGDGAFLGCSSLFAMTISEHVNLIGTGAFGGCKEMESITFLGKPPSGVESAGIPAQTVIRYPSSRETYWSRIPGNKVAFDDSDASADPDHSIDGVFLTTTNVVVHYVHTGICPEFALPPSADTGFVDIVTEVRGGCVAVPASWAENYPFFAAKYGSDFTKALTMKTGKKDGAGNEMLVWQDYVAGTDPTDEKDVFTASITIVDGKVTISYTPELDDARKAMRKYTIWGKTSLMDTNWTEVQDGHEAEYNFFKVSVEMR